MANFSLGFEPGLVRNPVICDMGDYRKIIHIDMDAFYASVEQRDNPSLRGKPVAVGSGEERGVVATASYEARKYGVRSAQSSAKARRLCPEIIFVTPRFDVYKAVSSQMHAIFHEYTDIIEPISLDEAFLDVTQNRAGLKLGVDVAKEIKQKIRNRLGLTASAGVSYNKFLAKIASDLRKPDGLATIHPSIAPDFVASLKVEDFWGVGPKTAEKLHSMGVFTGRDLRALPLDTLTRAFGKTATVFYNFARAIDDRPVEAVRQRKSVGCEYTYPQDLTDENTKRGAMAELAEDLEERLRKHAFCGHTLTLKVKFPDFTIRSKSCGIPENTPLAYTEILSTGLSLLERMDISDRPVRLMGLTVSSPAGFQGHKAYEPDSRQLTFD